MVIDQLENMPRVVPGLFKRQNVAGTITGINYMFDPNLKAEQEAGEAANEATNEQAAEQAQESAEEGSTEA